MTKAMRWKFITTVIAIALFGMIATVVPSPAALIESGFLSWSSVDSDIYATGPWAADSTKLSWEISQEDSLFRYTYEWYTEEKDLSHIIFEVSSNTDRSNFSSFETYQSLEDVEGPKLFSPGPGNPGMPGDIYGWKIDLAEDTTYFKWSFLSDRAPMDGNFYAKDGKYGPPGAKFDVIAYNSGFSGGDAYIRVPDTKSVPEPSTLIIIGAGLVGIAAYGRMRLKK